MHRPSGRRRSLKTLVIALVAGAVMAGCTAEEVGRGLYNAGKSFCAGHPRDCDSYPKQD